MVWDPPELSFTIERHGAMQLGSSRAQLQRWTVDVQEGKASYRPDGYRQVGKRNEPLYAEKLAEKIKEEIMAGEDAEYLRWLDENTALITLKTAVTREGESLPQETLDRRRRRLHEELDDKMEEEGWEKQGTARAKYRRPDS